MIFFFENHVAAFDLHIMQGCSGQFLLYVLNLVIYDSNNILHIYK